MSIEAKLILDSISPQGIRISTFKLRYPKFIHGEFMTHRVFSRNASSSRAIPFNRLLGDIERDMAFPLKWGREQKGMSAGDYFEDEEKIQELQHLWRRAFENVKPYAEALYNEGKGVHKQTVNRLLEPWMHINVQVTSVYWQNFFALRIHPAAQPEIKELAEIIKGQLVGDMKRQFEASIPNPLVHGQWHLPWIQSSDVEDMSKDTDIKTEAEFLDALVRLSVARSASISFETVEGLPMTRARAAALYTKLVVEEPVHASPAEHQATPDTLQQHFDGQATVQRQDWRNPSKHGNFTGWIQYRKLLPRENNNEEFGPWN